ncbi:unnamed protein product [Pelagomonas calceolata]|uniref:F-box domain-containing protein n=1 Tax=Pelagomonas calceolata TaxID=35677 RepID=A0A8J2SAM6_9STRA|nr:unnamed protein product [Pelagomonas calceolata]|mmetsp:Transcript_20635/g.63820  ORF Transcript_20635/g.63820 Transcript_20635/m.63820 type:complete len:343 (-) Transcript_20635:11-1039(-)
MTTMDASASFFTALPNDLLQRVLVGLPFDDHHAATGACQAFRGVITGSRFPALRQKYGFAERGIVTVRPADRGRQYDVTSRLQIVMAHKNEIVASIPQNEILISGGSTTDGGSRLFVSTKTPPWDATPNEVLTVDVSSRRWKRFATLPQKLIGHSIEWHGGLLYVAGGCRDDGPSYILNSFSAFNETTGLWEALPPMPIKTLWAASGIIGNQLFIAGGRNGLKALQIYDIPSRTWRLGPWIPNSYSRSAQYGGFVVDGKLCLMNVRGSPILVYDPQANTWTEEAPRSFTIRLACVHDGRLIVYRENSIVIARANDGSWFPYAHVEPQRHWSYTSVSRSILLG